MVASPQVARLFRSIAPPLPKKPYGFPGTPYMLDFMAGQEYHYPYCLSSPHREPPGVFSLLFLASCGAEQTGDLFSNKVASRYLRPADHGAAADVAHAFWQKQ